MKLHAHAPLGPKGRLTMVRRVVEECQAGLPHIRRDTQPPARVRAKPSTTSVRLSRDPLNQDGQRVPVRSGTPQVVVDRQTPPPDRPMP
jgi:hypothetical protein